MGVHQVNVNVKRKMENNKGRDENNTSNVKIIKLVSGNASSSDVSSKPESKSKVKKKSRNDIISEDVNLIAQNLEGWDLVLKEEIKNLKIGQEIRYLVENQGYEEYGNGPPVKFRKGAKLWQNGWPNYLTLRLNCFGKFRVYNIRLRQNILLFTKKKPKFSERELYELWKAIKDNKVRIIEKDRLDELVAAKRKLDEFYERFGAM